MITYVLIAISLGQITDHVTTTTFHSKLACESAAQKINQSGVIASKVVPGRRTVLGAYCQPDMVDPQGSKVGAR